MPSRPCHEQSEHRDDGDLLAKFLDCPHPVLLVLQPATEEGPHSARLLSGGGGEDLPLRAKEGRGREETAIRRRERVHTDVGCTAVRRVSLVG